MVAPAVKGPTACSNKGRLASGWVVGQCWVSVSWPCQTALTLHHLSLPSCMVSTHKGSMGASGTPVPCLRKARQHHLCGCGLTGQATLFTSLPCLAAARTCTILPLHLKIMPTLQGYGGCKRHSPQQDLGNTICVGGAWQAGPPCPIVLPCRCSAQLQHLSSAMLHHAYTPREC